MIQASTQRRKRNAQSSVSPQFLLRVGGLPIDVVDALRFADTASHIEQLLAIEQKLSERKDALVDALFDEVTAHKEDQALRRRLINLKRDIFNLKMLDALEEKRSLALKLSTPARELLLAWLDLWSDYRELLAQGPALLAQELEQKRSMLKATIDTPNFRKGIALASPVLANEVDTYLASDNHRLNRNARTVERSLLEYLLRTACKTSPFSTFTSVSSGSFVTAANETSSAVTYQVGEMQQRSFTTLNVIVLYRLSQALLNAEALRKDLPVRLTTGWQIQGEHIRYVRRLGLDNGEEEGPMALSAVHEDVFYLPRGHLLDLLLTLLNEGKVMRLGEISASLCALPEYAEAGEEIDTLLSRLLHLGLLVVPELQLDLQNTRLLSGYCQGLRDLHLPLTSSLAEKLEQIEALVDTYASTPSPRRPALMSDIKQRIIDCFAILGGTEVAIPRTLIYEDTILPLSRLEASSAAWRNILTSMAELQQIMPAFDLNLEKKIVTRGYFRARYGAGQRCDDFLSFADEFRQNFFEQYLQGAKNTFGKKNTINHFQQPELDLLNQVPEVVTSSMLQAIARHQATGTADILLHEDFIQALAPYVPASVDRICSHAFFTQLAYEQGEALGVINHIYAGFTQNFSRFAHLFQDEENSQVLSTLKTTLQELCPPDVIFAELKGGYDATNLNIHSPVTAYELVCPGDKSSRAPDEQIPLEDLFLVDDEKAGRLKLCSKRLGKEVIPLYLGFLLPMALPEIQQILLNFSYASMCVLDLWKGMKEAPSETIVSYPRLRYKHLVLQRAYWKLTANLFPQRESGQDDFTFFLNINRWRRKLGLPRRLFLAPEKTFGTQKAQSASADEGAAAPQIRNYKPLFLDFENIFAVTLLEALVRDSTQTLVLSEVLPGQEQLWLKHRGQSYVSEFVLEMNTVKEESDA